MTTAVFDPQAVHDKLVLRQQIEIAERLCNTLVLDEDGCWLNQEVAQLRRKPRPQYGTVASIIDNPRTLRFRSKMPLHNMDEEHEADYYWSITMPAGFRVIKVSGLSYANLCFQLNNGLKNEHEESITLQFDREKRLYATKYFHGERRAPTGRRAGERMMGRGPDRSL